MSAAICEDRKPAKSTRPFRRTKPGSVEEAQAVEKYLPLVRSIVGRLAMTLPAHVEAEDLYSAGTIGLLNAVRNFNPKSGTALETYARVRIRGAVFDELRRMDWVPRSVHGKARKVQNAVQQLEQKKGKAPTEAEVAKVLKITLSEYQHWLEEIRPTTFICLDAAPNIDGDEGASYYESFADQKQEGPFEGTRRHELRELIAERLQQLPEIQRKVLALYYFEDLRLREIAEAFELTESRICQIHAQAIVTIKAHLQKYDLASIL
jgi:RNA polymerase sigma factor for flagellar operon FliA